MKKKIRILSIILCFVFLFLVGCGAGEEDFDDEDLGGGGTISTKMLSGVKALSKPSSYSFKDAVGQLASENYYNIFAHEILKQLYPVYENAFSDTLEIFDFTSDELANGITYQHFGDNEHNKYYLYDSIRYTIKKVTSNLNESDEVQSQTVTIDTNKGWNWSVPTSIEGTAFDKGGFEKSGSSYTIESDDWLAVMRGFEGIEGLPSFSQYYAKSDNGKHLEGAGGYYEYYFSPFYKEGYSGSEPLVNYYQDALEYATYLFVLGFDYVDDKGAEIADEKDYFNFTINLFSDNPIQVKAKAFGENAVPISKALETVKDWYKKMGNIVGLTDKNKTQLKRFILDKVIGKNSPDIFTVEMYNKKEGESETRDSSHDLTFNRNYNAVVENIISYACAQTRIGYSDGDYLTLDHEYMASVVKDYPGNNFFMNYKGLFGTNTNNDEYMFHFIQPGEYQSLVLMPELVDIENGLPLSDISLAFEYYNDDADFDHDAWSSDAGKDYADSITINVGMRFFDKTADGGEVLEFTPKQITIPYGRYNSFENDLPLDDPNKIFPDEYWLTITNDEKEGANGIFIDKEIKFDAIYGEFKNDIGGGAINAADRDDNTITLSGTNKAREFYVTQPSTSYGSYGILNYEKFMGSDGCDYLEIYFDIVKDKTKPNINYNFKVGLTNLFYDDGNHNFE